MKVKDLMTRQPRTCTTATTVAEAAHLMSEAGCGILPVLDDGKLAGVVTDRDMYFALATHDALPSQLPVGTVARRHVATCNPEDDVHAAVAMMKQAHVRRLPVMGFNGTVVGMLSLDDVVRAAGPEKDVRNEEVVETLQEICRHHRVLAPLITT